MKKKLLVLASTFPRWKNDTLPPFVFEISRRLTSEFEVSVLAPSYPGAKDYEVMDGVKVYRYHYFIKRFEKLAGSGGILPAIKNNFLNLFIVPFFMLSGYLALRKLVRKIKPDIIHAHWLVPQGLFAAIINKQYGIPFVVTAHGGDVFGLRGGFSRIIRRFILKQAGAVTAVSGALSDELHKSNTNDKEIQIIPMGIDTDIFNPNKTNRQLKDDLAAGKPAIIFVGRLVEKKGLDYLLKAMPEIIGEFPGIVLMIIGDGPENKKSRILSANLGINEHVLFMGAMPNASLAAYYAASDVFVGPSVVAKNGDTEGFGITFLEAMASGCVVVGTNVGGIQDLIKNKRTGFIVEQKNPEEISKTVVYALKHNAACTKIKKDARKFAIEKFDWKYISAKYGSLLKTTYNAINNKA